jgi:hypothetical protein
MKDRLIAHSSWATRKKDLRRSPWIDFVVIGFFLVATLVLAWPLIGRIDTHLAGNDNDTYINVWANWWTRRVLFEGSKLFFCDYEFFPIGVDLTFHSFSHFNSLLCVVLSPLFGDIVAQNLTTLLAHVMTGVSTYCLVRYLTGKTLPAIVAGYLYTFSPFHISEASHPVLNTTQWLPLFTLFLIRMVRERRKRDGLWSGVFLFLTALSSWHLLLFTCGFALFYILYTLLQSLRRKDASTQSLVAPLMTFIVVSALLLGPLLYPVTRELLSGAAEEFVLTDRIGQADLLQFFRPPSIYPGIGSLLGIAPIKKSTYLGISVLIVAAYGAWHNRPQTNFWVWGTLTFFLLALGPYAQIGGTVYEHLVLPWGWPMGQLFRDPPRIAFLITFCLAVLVGFAIATIQDRVSPKDGKGRWWLLTTVVGVMVFDVLYLPYPLIQPPVVSGFYDDLAAEDGDFAILELPFGRTPARYYAYYQTIHEKRTVEGIASRQPKDAYAYIRANPFLAEIKKTGEMPDTITDVSQQLSVLADDDIRYLILHKKLRYNRFDQWRDYMIVPPIYEDDQLVVYRTRPPHGTAYDPAINLDAPLGLDRLEANIETTYRAGQTMGVHARWVALEPPSRALDCRFVLHSDTNEIAQIATEPIYPGWSTAEWQTGTIAFGEYVFQPSPLLPSGRYTLTLSVSAEGQPVGRETLVGAFDVVALERNFELPEPENPVDVRFGDDLRLLGYDVYQAKDEGQAAVTLYWRAEQRMSRSYKFFVHILNRDVDTIAAQADVIPRDWTYPTTWWEKGEIVSDEIRVPIDDLTPGEYRLIAGVYDSKTGTRLPTSEGDHVVLDEAFSIKP